MDSVRDWLQHARFVWQQTTPIQRTVMSFGALVVIVGGLFLNLQQGAIEYVPLSLGKEFSLSELSSIENSLRAQELTDFKREGGQLLVPAEQQTAYDAALMQEQQLPRDWASEWEAKYEETNPFTSSRKLKMMKEIALAKELKRIIQGLDGIAEANVVWAETESKGWPARGHKVTASVNLRPEPGQTLSPQTIRAIQFSVANMVPNLEPQDVLVLDYAAGRHYQMQPEQAQFESELDQWMDRELSRWQTTLNSALQHHWPGSTLQIEPGIDAFRQTAWQLALSQSAAKQKSPEFLPIEPQLRQRFPEFLMLSIELPDGTNPTSELSIEQELHAALMGWLPATFQTRQLQVAIATPVLTTPTSSTAVGTPPSWQPVAVVGLAGVLLFVVSRKLRSEPTPPLPQQSENGQTPLDIVEPPITASSEPAIQPVNPLGDPEVVADVLKHWLNSPTSEQDAD